MRSTRILLAYITLLEFLQVYFTSWNTHVCVDDYIISILSTCIGVYLVLAHLCSFHIEVLYIDLSALYLEFVELVLFRKHKRIS